LFYGVVRVDEKRVVGVGGVVSRRGRAGWCGWGVRGGGWEEVGGEKSEG